MNVPLPVLVALGGALGAVARFVCGGAITRAVASSFPWGTLTVNVVGSLAIGAILGVAEGRGGLSDAWRAFAVTGVLGGFTTFSAFSAETLGLIQRAHYGVAAANVAVSVALGLAAVVLGFAIGRALT
ncbi:MAG: fluoride efflux transporter CrcB [Planctomycetes bacterium]|nr:fluoride efflux transporter CrcB [Planctomycetota bacterium]MCC7173109.1 fluoride efflux transporter CrcB [Planctomycetota bacterium]